LQAAAKASDEYGGGHALLADSIYRRTAFLRLGKNRGQTTPIPKKTREISKIKVEMISIWIALWYTASLTLPMSSKPIQQAGEEGSFLFELPYELFFDLHPFTFPYI
jgi:hypothetical protein